jgi:uncharacterized membrane protein
VASVASGALPHLALVLLLPTLGVGFFSPLMLGILPLVLSRFISPNLTYWSLSFHYNDTLTIIVAMATLDGLTRLGGLKWSPGKLICEEFL